MPRLLKIQPGIYVIPNNYANIAIERPVYAKNSMNCIGIEFEYIAPSKVFAFIRDNYKGQELLSLAETYPSKAQLSPSFKQQLITAIPTTKPHYIKIRNKISKFALNQMEVLQCDRPYQLQKFEELATSQLSECCKYEIENLKISKLVKNYLKLYIIILFADYI